MNCIRFEDSKVFCKTSHFQRRIFLAEKRKSENSPSSLHHNEFASTARNEDDILTQYFYGSNDH